MADSKYSIDEIRFDVRDPDVTHVYAFVHSTGDFPHMLLGWHHRAFPASLTTFDIMQQMKEGKAGDVLLWDIDAPPTPGKMTDDEARAMVRVVVALAALPTAPGIQSAAEEHVLRAFNDRLAM